MAWSKWRESEKPSSKPLYTLSFDRIAGLLQPESRLKISMLRISHPQMGRLPGTLEQEQLLQRAVVTLLAERVTETSGLAWQDTSHILTERAAAIALTTDPYPTDKVAIRRVGVSGYVSLAKSPKALAKALDFLALIHGGYITAFDKQPRQLLPLLVSWPQLRLDACELDAQRLPAVNLGF